MSRRSRWPRIWLHRNRATLVLWPRRKRYRNVGWATFHNRRAVQIENDNLRVTVMAEGGHIAEILHKQSGVNPLWIPPWPSIDPSTYSLAKHPEYGADAESKLLAGIMGRSEEHTSELQSHSF